MKTDSVELVANLRNKLTECNEKLSIVENYFNRVLALYETG